jgi:hypothetical protein
LYTIDVSGVMSSSPTKSVGIQYADESNCDSHVLRPPRSDAGVVAASTERFPMYVWLCDFPG